MFPIVGPTQQTDFKIETPSGEAILDQHGIARLINFELNQKTSQSLKYSRVYKENTNLNNPKASNNNSNPKEVFWPYNFEMNKTFNLTDEELIIEFEIMCEEAMPYMFGYHPAFKLSGNKNEFVSISGNGFLSKSKNVSYNQIEQKENTAYQVKNISNSELVRPDKELKIEIKTKGFNNMMFWTNHSSMLCVEPITHLPYPTTTTYFGNKILGPKKYKVTITPKKIQ